jgi:hypothetical protein
VAGQRPQDAVPAGPGDAEGFRLRPQAGVTFETLAALVEATMKGLVMMALTVPGTVTYRTAAQPFDAPRAGEWSLPSLGLGALAAAFLEPDPRFSWDAARAAALRDALATPDLRTQPPRKTATRSG